MMGGCFGKKKDPFLELEEFPIFKGIRLHKLRRYLDRDFPASGWESVFISTVNMLHYPMNDEAFLRKLHKNIEFINRLINTSPSLKSTDKEVLTNLFEMEYQKIFVGRFQIISVSRGNFTKSGRPKVVSSLTPVDINIRTISKPKTDIPIETITGDFNISRRSVRRGSFNSDEYRDYLSDDDYD